MLLCNKYIGVGRLRILGGGGQGLRYWGGGGARGAISQQAHGVELTSMRRNNVASTSVRRHMPTRFLINQCQIITFLIIKSDNIENSRIDLKGIILQVPSNQIKVTFIIILPFNLVHLKFFLFHIEIEGKYGWINGVGGGAKAIRAPPPPTLPTPMKYCGISNRDIES